MTHNSEQSSKTQSQLSVIWKELTNTPVDANDCITEIFGGFPAGTHREKIWHWIEDTFNVCVHDLMYSKG